MPWQRSLLTSGASQPSSVLFMINQHPEIVRLILEFIGEAGADDVSVWRQRVSAQAGEAAPPFSIYPFSYDSVAQQLHGAAPQ